MSVKTKAQGFLVVAAVAVVGYVMLPQFVGDGDANSYSINKNRDRPEDVTVTVEFWPRHLSDQVSIDVALEGVPVARDNVQDSPWGLEFSAPVGKRIKLTALADAIGTRHVTCRIFRGAKQVQADSRTGPGLVLCIHPYGER